MEVELPYSVFVEEFSSREIHIYISEEIIEPIRYTEIIHLIRTASCADTIIMHLNTPGGRVDTGLQIISAMQSTEAHVITSLEGEVASMGACIFLCGKQYYIHDNTSLMFHSTSFTITGKAHETESAINAAIQQNKVIARSIYKPFLTESEIKQLIDGSDLYFTNTEISQRLKKVHKVKK